MTLDDFIALFVDYKAFVIIPNEQIHTSCVVMKLGDASSQVKVIATISGFIAIFLWSLTVALLRSISETIGLFTGGAGIYAVASLCAMVSFVISSQKRQTLRNVSKSYVVVCGGLFVLCMVSLSMAVGIADSRSQVLEVGLINYLWPAITILSSLVILRYQTNWLLVPGTLLALGGVFLVLTNSSTVSWEAFLANVYSNPLAYVLALVAALTWGLYSVFTRKWAGQLNGVPLFMLMTAVVFGFVSCWVDEPRGWTMSTSLEVVAMGIATMLAYSLWDYALKAGNFVIVAAASYAIPLLSMLVSAVYLDVSLTFRLWAGCGILIGGSILSKLSVRETT